MNDDKILIDGQEALNAIAAMAKDANANHKNHAYWKGLRDAYKVILYLVEKEAKSHGTGKVESASDLKRTITPVGGSSD